MVLTYHPALNCAGKVVRDLYSMLSNSEEHREVFPEPPVTAFRRYKNLKDMLVRTRLTTSRVYNATLSRKQHITEEQAARKRRNWEYTDQLLINQMIHDGEVTTTRRNLVTVSLDYKKRSIAYHTAGYLEIGSLLKYQRESY